MKMRNRRKIKIHTAEEKNESILFDRLPIVAYATYMRYVAYATYTR